MKNKLLVVILCLCYTLSLHGQHWEITPFRGGVDDVIEHPSGYLLGTGSDSDLGRAVAFRLSAEGVIEWKTTLVGRHGYAMCQWSDHEFVILGLKHSGVPTDTLRTIFLSKVNQTGEILWEREYNMYSEWEVKQVIRTVDNSLIVTGRYNKAPNSNDLNFVMKLDADGNFIFRKDLEGSLATLQEIYALRDGNFLMGSSEDQGKLVKLDANLNVLENYPFQQANNMMPVEIIPGPDGTVTILSDNHSWEESIHFTRINAEGEVMKRNDINRFVVGGSNDGVATVDGTYAIAGYLPKNEEQHADIYITKLDENGDVLWDRSYGRQLNGSYAWEYFGNIREAADGGFILCGGSDNMAYIVKTDIHGNTFPNFIKGQVFHDVDGNCVNEGSDLSLSNWVVQAVGLPGTYYGITDEDGNYEINVPAGVFEVSVLTLSPYWGSSCSESRILSLGAEGDIQTFDIPVEALVSCPIIDVTVASDRLRRCFPSTYEVDYCNTGTVVAIDGYIDLTLDPFLILDSAEVAYTEVADQVYRFEVGTVELGECGQFQVYTTLSCDQSIPLGQVHCVEASSFPDTSCLSLNQTWDGAEIEVEGLCRSDTVFFQIANVGVGDMTSPLTYIVIEDQIILHEKNFQLDKGTFIVDTIIGMGSEYTLIAQQALGGFGSPFPNVTVVNCGEGTSILQIQLPNGDNSPFHDLHCLENVDSYDPNDKQAIPDGWGDEKLVLPNTRMEYKIRFQNTGTDTAYTVLLKDRIDASLDIKSIRPGTSSHPYSWSINDGEYLSFTFENIDLPDSTTNLGASQGFVTFTIEQKADLPIGTEIQNTAAIYFDFNPPIYTNTTKHKIGDLFTQLPTNVEEVFSTNASVRIFPNPVTDQAIFQVQGVSPQAVELQVFDLSGRLVHQKSYENSQFRFDRGRLPAGLYAYSLRLADGRLLQGKLTIL